MGFEPTPAPTNNVSPAQWLGRVLNHWDGDTSLVGGGVGSNPSRYKIFLIIIDLVEDLGGLDSSSIH